MTGWGEIGEGIGFSGLAAGGIVAAGKGGNEGGGGKGGKGGKGGDGEGDEDGRTGLVTKTRPKTKKPSLYRVLILNDDYTPMEFVVHVLEKYFSKGREEATRIMLHVHHKGSGICGVFTYEVAETKVTQVMDFARQHGHPLQCTMEKE
ncbi:MAG: ATP-dependent Clp protease adapter ClpS [Hyphomicrobium sp.]